MYKHKWVYVILLIILVVFGCSNSDEQKVVVQNRLIQEYMLFPLKLLIRSRWQGLKK